MASDFSNLNLAHSLASQSVYFAGQTYYSTDLWRFTSSLWKAFCSLEESNPNSSNTIVIIGSNHINTCSAFNLGIYYNILIAPLDPNLHPNQLCLQIQQLNPRLILLVDIPITILPSTYHSIAFCNSDINQLFPFSNDAPPQISINNSPYLLTYSSGSTSSPKGILFSLVNKISRALSAIKLWNIDSSMGVLCASPFHHSLGQRLYHISLLSQATFYLFEKFDCISILQTIQSITSPLFYVPVSTHLTLLSEYDSFWTWIQGPLLSTMVVSSSSLDSSLRNRLFELRQHNIFEMYGASEIGTASYTRLQPTNKSGVGVNVGIPVPDVDIKIIRSADSDFDQIVVSTPSLCIGYLDNDELFKSSFVDNYFITGDSGYLLDNSLYFLGRTNEIINSGGRLVFPQDIDSAIQLLPYIKDSKTIPCTDSYFGQRPCVFASLSIPLDDISSIKRKIRAHCARTLSSFQIPKSIFILPELPTLRSGKIDVQALFSLLH